MRATIVTSDNPGMQSVLSRVRDVSSESFDRLNAINTNFLNNVRDLGNGFRDRIQNTTDSFLNRDVVMKAITSIGESGAMSGDVMIYPTTVVNMRRIGYKTRRFNMANPRIQRLYRLNRLNGYDGIWDNREKDIAPKERLDYLMVNDGFVSENNEKLTYTNVYNRDERLTLDEKLTIKNSWAFLDDLIATGEDPTELLETKIHNQRTY